MKTNIKIDYDIDESSSTLKRLVINNIEPLTKKTSTITFKIMFIEFIPGDAPGEHLDEFIIEFSKKRFEHNVPVKHFDENDEIEYIKYQIEDWVDSKRGQEHLYMIWSNCDKI